MKTYNYKNYLKKIGNGKSEYGIADAKAAGAFRRIKLAFLAFNVAATIAFMFFIILMVLK